MEDNNYIVGVVVKFKDICICLPKPNRHSDCFRKAREAGINKESGKASDQGFYLADGTFLSREEAYEHVKKVNQPLREEPRKNCLFSENVW